MLYGHKKEFEFLHDIIAKSEYGKTFLISGPEMIGKRKMIFELDADSKIKYPDNYSNAIMISAPEGKSSIGIDEIRELKRMASISLNKNSFKFIILDNAHQMTHEAQNAFLKLAEETSQRFFYFLVTHLDDAILPTLKSRAFKIKCQPVSLVETNEYLASTILSDAQKKYINANFCGRIGLIDKIIQDTDKFKLTMLYFNDYLQMSAGERLILNKKLLELYEDPTLILYIYTLISSAQKQYYTRYFNEAYVTIASGSNPKLVYDKLAVQLN